MTQRETFASLKAKIIENKRRIIIGAAERVVESKPLNKVGVRDIAREAGISHATIYSYFADQRSLFGEAFVHLTGGRPRGSRFSPVGGRPDTIFVSGAPPGSR